MTKEEKLIKEAMDQAELAEEHYRHERAASIEDLEFVYAEDQWDQEVKDSRGNRPTLNANDLPIFLDQIVGDQRMNRAGIKVHPVDSQTDPMKAEIIGGLIRNIEHVSDAHVAYDKALEFAAAAGYAGAIRVITQYEDENLFDSIGRIKGDFEGEAALDAFNQEIRIIPVENPLNVLYDPNAKLWHKNDGDFMFYYDDILVDTFDEKYPKARKIDFSGEYPPSVRKWFNSADKTIRVAEWFRKEPKGSKTVYLIMDDNGEYQVTDVKPEDKSKILKSREVEDFDIVWRLISGYEVLEGPIKIPGKLFPIIPVWGKEVNINGDQQYRGMFRYAKDPQRGYIYTQSAVIESVALAPKAPFIGTPKMFEGHEDKWRTANTDMHAFLPYNPDELAPTVMPKRTDPVQPPTGLLEQAATRQQEKRNVIGLQEANLGRKSNETSGRAIMERRRAGDSVTFAFIDNLNRAIRQTGRVILGMIPIIYSEKRMLRIIGVDGKQDQVEVNEPFEKPDGTTGIIDLTVGKHDVVIMTGPGYATQRIELVDRLTQIMQYAPNIAALVAPTIIEMMDIPHSDKVVKILEAMLPPQAQAAVSGQPPITPEQMQQFIAQAVEEYKKSVDAQIEMMKTQQQAMKSDQAETKLKQSVVQLQEELVKLEQIINKPEEKKSE